MALCSNSTSILEIAFGVNAVFGVMLSRVTTLKKDLADVAIAAFQRIDSDFDPKNEERDYFEKWIGGSLQAFRLAKFVSWIPTSLSFLFMTVSVGTLYQLALWGEKCAIPDARLAWMSIVFIFFAPVIYALHERFHSHLILVVSRQTFTNLDVDAADFELYKICWKSHCDMKDLGVLLKQIELREAKRNMDKLRKRLEDIRHPFQFILSKFQTWRVNRMVKKLMQARKADST